MQFDTIELAIEALRNGESIIVVDDEDRENEGDLVAVTEWMDDNTINFMAKEGRGLICAPIDKSIAERLKLQSMEQNNTDIYEKTILDLGVCPFCYSTITKDSAQHIKNHLRND